MIMNEELKQYLKPGKKNIVFIYITYLFVLLIPPVTLIGAYFAYTNQNAKNKLFRSHYIFAFRTFVVAVVVGFIAILANFIIVGPILQYILIVWIVVRSIIALQYLMEENEHPNPLTFWIK